MSILGAILGIAYTYGVFVLHEPKPQEFFIEYALIGRGRTNEQRYAETDDLVYESKYEIKKISLSYYKKDLIKPLPIRWFSIMGKTGIEFVEDTDWDTLKKRKRVTIPAYLGANFLDFFYFSGGILFTTDGSKIRYGTGLEFSVKAPLLFKNLSLKIGFDLQNYSGYDLNESNMFLGLGYAY